MARVIDFDLEGTVRLGDGTTQPISVSVARGYWERLLGLMGQRGVPLASGLLFPRCASIHTFWMRVPIDVLWLGRPEPDGRTLRVTGAVGSLEPNRVELAPHGTWGALEVRAQTLAPHAPVSVEVSGLTLGDLRR